MRIAIVHSFYSRTSSSGENTVVQSQVTALSKHGHQVQLISVETDELIRSGTSVIKSAFRVATGRGRSPIPELRAFNPDATLVHNLHPNFGSLWMSEWDGPIVRVLHNFRLFCANGIFFRDDTICTDCVTASPVMGLKHACYRGSRLATLPLTIAQSRRNYSMGEMDAPDFYLALSDSSKSLLVESGLKDSKIRVIPNFVDDHYKDFDFTSIKQNGRWLAVGRLTREKGFIQLAKAWPKNRSLDIVGDGPLTSELEDVIRGRHEIRLLGRLDRSALVALLPSYTGAVLPSLWFEVAPLTALEFLSAGLPIITARVNSVASILDQSNAGVVVESLNTQDLTNAIATIQSNHAQMSTQARAFYKENHTPEEWVARLEAVLLEIAKAN